MTYTSALDSNDLRRCVAVPDMISTLTLGHQRANSRFHVFLTVFGQTTRAGNTSSPSSCSAFSARIACAVLPRPGSSASSARRATRKNLIPARWCGNSSSSPSSSSTSRRLFAGSTRLVRSLLAQATSESLMTRSLRNVDRRARQVDQPSGTFQTFSVVDQVAPGILLQSSL